MPKLLLILLAISCGDATASPEMDAGARFDGGGGSDAGGDTGGSDAGPSPMASLGVPASGAGGADVREFGEFAGMTPPDANADTILDLIATCYDGEDNDDADGRDCNDPECRGLGACCVGQGDCCSEVSMPEIPESVALSGCASLSCLGTAWRMFGNEASLSDDGLSPEGSATGDGGVVFREPVNLHTTRAHLSMALTPPDDCDGSCLESLSVGFVLEEPAMGDGVVVQPDVALAFSGSRDTIALLLSGREHVRFDREGLTEVALTLEPTGRVIVTRGSEETVVNDAFVPRPLHLAVWGRSRNPGASDNRAIALTSLSTSFELCDMPRAWEARREAGGVRGTAPSLGSNGTETRLAYVDEDGAIRIATHDGMGTFTNLAARLEPSNVSYAETIDDPELIHRGGQWELFFTARLGDDVRIGRATVGDDRIDADAAPLLEDAWAPTLAASLDGRWVLVVRTSDGFDSYVDDGAAFVRLMGSRLDDVVEGLLGVPGNPSLVLHDRAWHLYLPMRRGTRWSVELLASEEALVWRDVDTTLAGSGESFDRLGVRGVDALAGNDRVDMVYEGDDGVRRRLGWTHRAGTSNGSH